MLKSFNRVTCRRPCNSARAVNSARAPLSLRDARAQGLAQSPINQINISHHKYDRFLRSNTTESPTSVLSKEDVGLLYYVNLDGESSKVDAEALSALLNVYFKITDKCEKLQDGQFKAPQELAQPLKLAQRALTLHRGFVVAELNGEVFFSTSSDGFPIVPIFFNEAYFKSSKLYRENPKLEAKEIGFIMDVYQRVKAPGTVHLSFNETPNKFVTIPNAILDSAFTKMIVDIIDLSIANLKPIGPEVLEALLKRKFYLCFSTENNQMKAAHLRVKGSNYSVVLSCGPEIGEENKLVFSKLSGEPLEKLKVVPITLQQAFKIASKIPQVYGIDFSCGLVDRESPSFVTLFLDKIFTLYEKAGIPLSK